MTLRPRLLALLALVLVCIGLAPSAHSQVVVYSVDFKHESGFNLEFFEGGYFVAPALGGQGTFILTSIVNGRRTLTSSAGTGNFFHGVDEKGKRITVVSATGGDGATSNASYLAFGDVTGTIEVVTPLANFKLKVARKLKGQALAAGDESGTTTTTDPTTTDTTATDATTTSTTSSSDGTVGFANISSMTLSFNDGETRKANEKEQTADEAATALATSLKQRGYVEASTTTGTDTGTDTGTGTGTGTTIPTTTTIPTPTTTTTTAP